MTNNEILRKQGRHDPLADVKATRNVKSNTVLIITKSEKGETVKRTSVTTYNYKKSSKAAFNLPTNAMSPLLMFLPLAVLL